MLGELSIISDMQKTPRLWQKMKNYIAFRWLKVKEKSEKTDLKLNIQKTKIMASRLITSWQIDRRKVETVTYFIFLGSKITVDGDYSNESQRCLFLGRKAMTNLDCI